MNKVILIGNLGGDPEVKNLQGDKKVANFSVATTERYKDKEGDKQEFTEWHRITLWGGLAGIAEQYLRKGSKVCIEGRIKAEQWEDENGNTRHTTKIVGSSLEMLGGQLSNEARLQVVESDEPPF